MKKSIYLLLLLISACTTKQPPKDTSNYSEKVNPFIGTDGKGKTYPGATLPFGMVQLSPDNGHGGWDWISGYFYPDTVIAGFSHTHLSGTGIGELYDIVYFYTQFSRPFLTPDQEKIETSLKYGWEGKDFEITFDFGDLKEVPLLVKTGISSVSEENAFINLEREILDWNFESIREQAEVEWQRQLAKIDFHSSIPGVEEVFYTALYQSMLAPTIFQDINGQYKAADPEGATKTATGNLDLEEWKVGKSIIPKVSFFLPKSQAEISKYALRGRRNSKKLFRSTKVQGYKGAKRGISLNNGIITSFSEVPKIKS